MTRTLPTWVVVAGGTAIVIAYLALLPFYPLSDPDEARYAEIPREMLERGDWVTPHLNYVKYFEKPPLMYWLTALSLALLGATELAARAWIGAFALTGIGLAYVLGRAMYGTWIGYAAAAVLAAMPMYYGIGQFLTLDTALSVLMAIGLTAFWLAYQGTQPRRVFLLAAYGATALAVLTKGPVAAVLNGGIVALFLVLQRDLRALRWLLSPAGIALFLLIVLPWFVLVSTRNPEFLHFFIVDQHLARYASPREHQRPFWYYAPLLLAGTLPWNAFVLLAPRFSAPRLLRLVRLQVSPATRYLLVWSAVVFLFFSASGSKLGTYVLPMMWPLAILSARFLRDVLDTAAAGVLQRGYWFMLIVGVIAVAGGFVTPMVTDDWRVVYIAETLIPAGVIALLAGTAALCLLHRQALSASVLALWVGMLALQMTIITGRSVGKAYPHLGRAVREHAREDDLVIGYRRYVQGPTFYAGRRFIQVRGHGELEFGRRQGDQRAYFWPDDSELVDAWASDRRVFLMLNRSEFELLRSILRPEPRIVASERTKVLIANFADDGSR